MTPGAIWGQSWRDKDGDADMPCSVLVQARDSQNSLLRNFYITHHFHSLLAAFLFFQQFFLASDIAAVTFSKYVFAQGLDVGARDHAPAGVRLDGDIEGMAWDDVFKLGHGSLAV